MNIRWIAVLGIIVLPAAGTGVAAVSATSTPAARARQLPPAARTVKGLQLKPVVPRVRSELVKLPLHLKFDCSYSYWGISGIHMYQDLKFVYLGSTPVTLADVAIHWDIPGCCSGNVGLGNALSGGPTLNYGDALFAEDPPGLPPGFLDSVLAGNGPNPTCTAYGWLDQ